jgi:hypothetical protein
MEKPVYLQHAFACRCQQAVTHREGGRRDCNHKSKSTCLRVGLLSTSTMCNTVHILRNHPSSLGDSQASSERVHPQYVVLVPPLNMHVRAWGQWLLHMNEYARQFGLRLASEHLDLVDEHIAELLLVLDEEVCEALYVRGTCYTCQQRLASIHIELSAPNSPRIAFVSGQILSKVWPGHSLSSQRFASNARFKICCVSLFVTLTDMKYLRWLSRLSLDHGSLCMAFQMIHDTSEN